MAVYSNFQWIFLCGQKVTTLKCQFAPKSSNFSRKAIIAKFLLLSQNPQNGATFCLKIPTLTINIRLVLSKSHHTTLFRHILNTDYYNYLWLSQPLLKIYLVCMFIYTYKIFLQYYTSFWKRKMHSLHHWCVLVIQK